MARLLAALVLGALSLTAAAAKSPLGEALENNGYTSFMALAEAAGISAPAPSAVLTIFAPTNQAIDAFLKRMNLTLEDMKRRPALSAAVVGYTVLPRVKGKASDVKGATKTDPLLGQTADGVHVLRFYMAPNDTVVIEDMQNNTANIVTKAIDVGNTVIYGIDKVMLSGDVFLSMEDLLVKHPQFRPLRALYDQAGLTQEVTGMKGDSNTVTIFAPTAKAVEAARPKLSALSKSQLQDVLRYHLLPGAYSIPASIKPDTPYPTAFKGHSLKFNFIPVNVTAKPSSNKTATPGSQQGQTTGKKIVQVVDEAPGKTEPLVNIANVFANRFIVHGIDSVLMPDLAKKAAPAATSAKPAAAASKQNSGRKLLQGWRQGAGPSMMSVGMTNTQSSIRAAVDGRVDPLDAAETGSAAARAANRRCWNCAVDNFGR